MEQITQYNIYIYIYIVSSSGRKEFSRVILNYVIRVLNIDYWVKDEFTQ
jgi:hypothetical protein